MSAQGGRRNRSPLHVRSSGAPFPVRGVLIVCVLYLLNKNLLILLCVRYNLYIVFFHYKPLVYTSLKMGKIEELNL